MQECARAELSLRANESAETRAGGPADIITPSDVLAMMPCGLRFLFLDEILEVDRTHISARYRFRKDEFFYQGHFPERAVTPGTVLLEAMCQCGITAHSYYFLAAELGIEIAKRYRVLFTNSEAEWFELVAPGSLVTVHSELLAWRLRRIRARVKLFGETNTLIAQSILAGTSVSWHPDDVRKTSLNNLLDNLSNSSVNPASEQSETRTTNTLLRSPNEPR
jgi:3-hydroxyacyl-[acyl-carrier-protein] dehydratase